MTVNCPKCGEPAEPNARFCEVCGARLASDPVAHAAVAGGRCRCGAAAEEVDEAGYCTQCGIKRELVVRDHVETCLSPAFAAVTDRGKRHNENQDDVRIRMVDTGSGPVYVMVVCDGVSGSVAASAASAAASEAACALLAERCAKADVDPAAALTEAVRQAHAAVLRLEYHHGGPKDPPETTIVAAVVRGLNADIAWVGDSRAYWFTESDAGVLTRDHSWVNDVVDAGMMTEAEALASPMAHAIVRCLGGAQQPGDAAIDPPSLMRFEVPAGATLLLCSDGLWNYTSEAGVLASLARPHSGTDCLALGRGLVEFANSQGGKDNITVAALSLN